MSRMRVNPSALTAARVRAALQTTAVSGGSLEVKQAMTGLSVESVLPFASDHRIARNVNFANIVPLGAVTSGDLSLGLIEPSGYLRAVIINLSKHFTNDGAGPWTLEARIRLVSSIAVGSFDGAWHTIGDSAAAPADDLYALQTVNQAVGIGATLAALGTVELKLGLRCTGAGAVNLDTFTAGELRARVIYMPSFPEGLIAPPSGGGGGGGGGSGETPGSSTTEIVDTEV